MSPRSLLTAHELSKMRDAISLPPKRWSSEPLCSHASMNVLCQRTTETTGKRPDKRLVGFWRGRHGQYKCQWLLRADGSYVAEVAEQGRVISRQVGAWVVDGAELLWVCSHDEFHALPPGDQERVVLLELGADRFILRTLSGACRKFERVR